MTDTPFLILLWLIVGLLVGAYEDQISRSKVGSWFMILNCFMSFGVALVLLYKATFCP